jgi:ubiquinone/menaquinone biosynthesis C-methylase UbiE
MKLNLASGTDIRDGWINLDIVPKWPLARRGCDVVWDARKDRIPYDDGSADEIYAGYLFLHLAPRHHDSVLKEIYRVLSPTGRLVVGEVDMEKVMQRFLENPADPRCHELIWGEQGDLPGDQQQFELAEFDKHCHGFTQDTLIDFLTAVGFRFIQRIYIHNPEVWYELTLSCRKT